MLLERGRSHGQGDCASPQDIYRNISPWGFGSHHDGLYSRCNVLRPKLSSPGPRSNGTENWVQLYTAFSDTTCETVALDAISERLWVWQWVLGERHTGSFRGLSPTGRRIALPGCEIIELRGDRVCRDVGYLDRLTMLASFGFTLAPSKPPA